MLFIWKNIKRGSVTWKTAGWLPTNLNNACMVSVSRYQLESKWPIIPESSRWTVPLHHQLKCCPKHHTSHIFLCPERDSSLLQTSFLIWKLWHKATQTLLIVTLLWGICQSDFTARITNGWTDTVSHKDSKAGLTAWLVFINIRLQGELLSVFWPDGQSVTKGKLFWGHT